MLQQSVAMQTEAPRPNLAATLRNTSLKTLRWTYHSMFAIGLIAIILVAVMFTRPELADDLLSLSPYATNMEEELRIQRQPLANLLTAEELAHIAAANSAQAADEAKQQALISKWLSRRYRVAHDATTMFVAAAYGISKEVKVDPLLILSVVSVESRFNPFAESPMGAQGLMQVMSKIHSDKFADLGGSALNPVANMRVGSMILKEYLNRFGTVQSALKAYVGAANMRTDGGYGAKVLSEYAHLKAVSFGKHVSIYASVRTPQPAEPETVMTSENSYGTVASNL